MKETILDVFLRKYRINMVKSTIIKYNDCKLLDIGCGWEARFLQSIENYISYGVGVDFKPPELKTDKLETIKLTLENKLPFEDSSFDVVTMLAVLEHLTYADEILKEINRVLKKDGRLIITVPSKIAKPILEFMAYNLKIIDRLEIEDHKKYYNKKDILESAELSNFTVEKHKYFQLGCNNFAILKKQ
ncbi:Methyltransferase type 11 [Brachyspira intermedia PWS/A]|uniref:Methyltransferase type 11 n=1 Tax=Brachyspira intermedia (strain ATCC 51140 / PWS/A) TaxID=1045858 RepID=G0EIW9_BRAIP|nr:class I SAM-dependent methyltransferase [Brachyspira intermedia]AEM21046.1 Methyltransferase type 11 [Brachyspira intermedia PWS/A]